jgi:hypothetical protein
MCVSQRLFDGDVDFIRCMPNVIEALCVGVRVRDYHREDGSLTDFRTPTHSLASSPCTLLLTHASVTQSLLLTYSLAHSVARSLTHLLNHSPLTHSITRHSLHQSINQSINQSNKQTNFFTHSTHSLTHSLSPSVNQSIRCLYPRTHSLTHSLTDSLTLCRPHTARASRRALRRRDP